MLRIQLKSKRKRLLLAVLLFCFSTHVFFAYVCPLVRNDVYKVPQTNIECVPKPLRGPQNGTDLCPVTPECLLGQLNLLSHVTDMTPTEALFPDSKSGGRYKPTECKARHKVAIIVPYRNRSSHLRTFLHHLHPILQRQQLDYGIFVVEQRGTYHFNRGILMNIGFVESSRIYDYQCFIFHDVDLLPESDQDIYRCLPIPSLLSSFIDKFQYKFIYPDIFGGVIAVPKHVFGSTNGFSNMYFGWGAEDDDFHDRIKAKGIKLSRENRRYTMFKHDSIGSNLINYELYMNSSHRMDFDGLNSLNYSVVDITKFRLYTHILVDLKYLELKNEQVLIELGIRRTWFKITTWIFLLICMTGIVLVLNYLKNR